MTMTYDMAWDNQAPRPGEYLVSIGKTGIGSIYLVKSIRKVVPRIAKPHARYSIEVVSKPELKELTDWNQSKRNPQVWVKGEEAHPLFWYPRNKKKRSP